METVAPTLRDCERARPLYHRIMAAPRASRFVWASAVAAVALALLVAMFWQNITLGLGIAPQDQRPALLADARLGQTGSARIFQQRFGPGTSLDALLRWLKDNDFVIDSSTREAWKTIGAGPCGERLMVRWISADKGRIAHADALVFAAGCV